MSGTFPVPGPSSPARAVAFAEVSAAKAGAPAALLALVAALPDRPADLVALSPEGAWQLAIEAPARSLRVLGALLDEFEQIESVAVNPAPRLLGELAGEIGAAADKLGSGVAALTPWLAPEPASEPFARASGPEIAPSDRATFPHGATHAPMRALTTLVARATTMAGAIAPRMLPVLRASLPALQILPEPNATPTDAEEPPPPPLPGEAEAQHAPSPGPQTESGPHLLAPQERASAPPAAAPPTAPAPIATAPVRAAPIPDAPAEPRTPHDPAPAAPDPNPAPSPAILLEDEAASSPPRSSAFQHTDHRDGAAPPADPEPQPPEHGQEAPQAPDQRAAPARELRDAASGMLENAAAGLTRMRQHLPPPDHPATSPGPANGLRPRRQPVHDMPSSRSEAEHAWCAAQITLATAQVLQAMRRAAEPDPAELRRRRRDAMLRRWIRVAAARAAHSRALPIGLALLGAGMGAWLLVRLDMGAVRSATAAALVLGLLAWRFGVHRRAHLRLELRR